MNAKSIFSLKVPVLVVFLLLWSIGFTAAVNLGRGADTPQLTPVAMNATGLVCLCAAAFCFAVASNRHFQTLVIAPARKPNFRAKDFYTLAGIFAFVALTRFAYPYLAA